MGSIPHWNGVAFRVWAPHARAVAVIGSFNNWYPGDYMMESENNGCWYLDIPEAKPGDEYLFRLYTDKGELTRLDPYATEVTSSKGNCIVHDAQFDWEGDNYHLPAWNHLVIYELHVGTFSMTDNESGTGTFKGILNNLEHLKKLGVNALEIMPVAEFAGERSWGYNPSQIFSVETSYGGPKAFKRFIRKAHQEGFAIILDVVYNHFGPQDLDLWQFDGWSENGKGGIYFYNDWRAHTPWGETRPDFSNNMVRKYIYDNAEMWLNEYHVDGLRFDSTQLMRTVDGKEKNKLPEAWSLMQWINGDIAKAHPGKIVIAEDMQNNGWLTKDIEHGGAGFGSQWDCNFLNPIRDAVTTSYDHSRSMKDVGKAISFHYNVDAFERVIFSESHDSVSNDRSRIPWEIDNPDPTGWHAQKRSTLAAALVFTTPGVPMIFQGQEFLESSKFMDDVPLNWDKDKSFSGIVNLYRDLIHLRLNKNGTSNGLKGQSVNVFHKNEIRKVVAFHRWDRGGVGDDIVVVANFFLEAQYHYKIGFPHPGKWKLLFNSDWNGYGRDFSNHPSMDVFASESRKHGFRYSAEITIGPYSALIFSRCD